jgi:alkanesulfonate monooxygenase SsuD/methylene tetrahydromethanopterin reductase-like flavin-dependent oxidoreductase (luciferase family)
MRFGLGAGGYEGDEAAIGMPIRTQSERLARLSECIDVLSRLWNGGDTSANGRFYPLDGYTSSPSLP